MSDQTTADGLRHTPLTSERAAKGLRVLHRSDPECFSPTANLYQPEANRPECFACGQVSHGGEFIEFFGGGLGKGTYIVKFACKSHGGDSWCILSINLYPSWRILTKREQGIYVCRKLSQVEQVERVKPESRNG